MKPALRFMCPKCGEKFPFLLGPSNRIRNGYGSTPWFKCAHCGLVSRQSVNWPHVLWAWPLAFYAVGSVIMAFQNIDELVTLRHRHPGTYGALGGLCMGACFFIIRFGMKLTPQFGEGNIHPVSGAKTWFKALILVGVVTAVALVTHRWIATLASLAICLAISGLFYLLSRKNDGTSGAPSGARDDVPAADDP